MLKKKLIFFGIITILLLGQVQAQDGWGVGLTGGYNLPISGLSDWYAGTGRFGCKMIFNTSKKSDIEVEYNFSKFNNGSIEDRMFSYKSLLQYPDDDGVMKTVDSLYSSNGSSSMIVNSITVNLVKYFDRMSFLDSRFFLTGGVGFYIHNHSVDSLLYAGRPEYRGKAVYLEPFEDKRVALGFNLGVGYEFKVTENSAFDLRARYNFFVSELRPLEAYRYEGEGFKSDGTDVGGLKSVFPIQYLDFSVTYKLFFN